MKKKEIDARAVPLNERSGISVYPRGRVISDPFGSYTGRPLDADEKPAQDADDL